eukprot:6782948-Prymnesium_polylepis.2
MRITMCTMLSRKGVPLEEISALAEHSSIEMTKRYIENYMMHWRSRSGTTQTWCMIRCNKHAMRQIGVGAGNMVDSGSIGVSDSASMITSITESEKKE